MTASTIWLQVGYALGFASFFWAGSKLPRRAAFGWSLGVLSEVGFCLWATLSHTYTAYPWVVAWAAVYATNWIKWRRA